MSDAGQRLYAVIPAGGSGTRLWPLSRSARPKFLHPLTGSAASLLQVTVQRLAPLATVERTYVVTGSAHRVAVARQLPDLPEENLLIEPTPRDSCAAIGLAAAVIARRDPDAVMGSFASDHLVRDHTTFLAAIEDAIAGADAGFLMTIGIRPTHPETGYGYLQCGGPTGVGGVLAVAEFKEKPSLAVAQAYVSGGGYLWNAGMFVWRASVFLDELRRQQPELHAGVVRIAQAWGGPDWDTIVGEVWPTLPMISVDHAVMEGAARQGLVATVPGDFGWNDIGDFDTLGEVLASSATAVMPGGNVVVGDAKAGPVLLPDTRDSVIVAQSGRLVAAFGVQDLIVVDTDDALLVCPRDRAQDIKTLVDLLKERGEDDYL
jgi:mannose-1-phosphate guanylyltransferase